MSAIDQLAELTIPIQLSKSDISQSVKVRALRTPFFWIVPLWIVGMVYFLLDSVAHRPQSYAWICALIAGVITAPLLVYRSSASIAKQPSALAPMTFVFSSYGITAEFDSGTNKAAWSLVKGARETGRFVIIEMQRRTFHLVPKRFLSDEQLSRLREIPRANVSKNVHLLA